MKSRSVAVLAALLVSLSPGLTGQTPARPPAQPADAPYTMALTGDSIITRRLSPYQEPAFLQMIDLIRNADVAFTNLEMLFHDYETYAMSQSGGTYMRAEPALAKELAWAGFDLVARANNHTGDYAPEAMRLTTKYVAEAGTRRRRRRRNVVRGARTAFRRDGARACGTRRLRVHVP